MGIHGDQFWPLAVLGVAFQVGAIYALRTRRGPLFAASQFAAAFTVQEAGVSSHWVWMTFLGAFLFWLLPLAAAAWIAPSPGLAFGLLTTAGLSLFGGTAVWRTMSSPDFRPRPMDHGRWSYAWPVSVPRPSLVIQPERESGHLMDWIFGQRVRPARLVDWAAGFQLDWTPLADHRRCPILIQNFGQSGSLAVAQGRLEIVPGEDSYALLRCEFSEEETTCLLVPDRSRRNPLTLLIVGGVLGDVLALEALLIQAEAVNADAILAVGDMIRPGDYLDLLAVRDALDAQGRAVCWIPGEAERADGLIDAFRSHFGTMNGARVVGGVVLASPSTTEAFSPADSLFLPTAHLLGPFCLALDKPLLAPKGREDALLRDPKARERLSQDLPNWKVQLVASAAPGRGYEMWDRGVLHLTLGRDADRLDAARVTITEGRIDRVEWFAGDRGRSKLDSWKRAAAAARESPLLGRVLALGWTGVPASLLALLLFILRRRRSAS